MQTENSRQPCKRAYCGGYVLADADGTARCLLCSRPSESRPFEQPLSDADDSLPRRHHAKRELQ